MPHAYACYVKYSRRGVYGQEILAPAGSSWQFAFDAFRKFFKTKTLKDWNDRLDKKSVQDVKDNREEHPFMYQPPEGANAPQGLVTKKTRIERIFEAQSTSTDRIHMSMPTMITISDDEDDGFAQKYTGNGESSHGRACALQGTEN